MTSERQELLINCQTRHYKELGRIASTLIQPDWSYNFVLISGKVKKYKEITIKHTDNRREEIDEVLLRCLLEHKTGKLATCIKKRDWIIADLKIRDQLDYDLALLEDRLLRKIQSIIADEVGIINYMTALGFLPGHCRLCVI